MRSRKVFVTLFALASFGWAPSPRTDDLQPPPRGKRSFVSRLLSAVEAMKATGHIIHKSAEDNRTVHDAAVYGTPDFREVDAYHALGQSTVAFFWNEDLEQRVTHGWPTNASVLEGKYHEDCNTHLREAMRPVHHLPNGALASGALVRKNIVVTPSHVATTLSKHPGAVRAVFGFSGGDNGMNDRLKQIRIAKVCIVMHDEDEAIGLIKLNETDIKDHEDELPKPLAPVRTIEDPTTPREVMAFGHPLGSSRLMTGNNSHTTFRKCPGGYGATLDTLGRSSGSPVFIFDTTNEPILFGVIKGGPKNVTMDCDIIRNGRLDIDPCTSRGPRVRILKIDKSHADIDALSNDGGSPISRGDCFTPSNPCKKC